MKDPSDLLPPKIDANLGFVAPMRFSQRLEKKEMGKAKHQKPKPKKQAEQSHSKKGGDQADTSKLRGQLDALGLKIIQVTADGNCFFRALGDQLDGNEDEHEKYRSMVAQFIKNNCEMFEPFVEDEVPFHAYCQSIGEDGTWAGNMELQAASLVTHTNICIHRHMSPRWYIKNFDVHAAPMIHLSYHDGEHYNSVRSKDDPCSGPARPIVIKGDANLSAKSNQPNVAAMKSKRDSRGRVGHGESIEMVKFGSGCKDARKVEQALQEMGGDVDAAIEVLIAEQEHIDQKVSHDDFFHSVKSSHGNARFLDGNQDENSEPDQLKVEEYACKQDLTGKLKEKNHKNLSQPDEKKISRNKACPCGSKRKYKSCCGSVAGTSYGRFPNNQTVDYGKSRRDRKQGRNGGSTIANFIQSYEGLPDMGALCI